MKLRFLFTFVAGFACILPCATAAHAVDGLSVLDNGRRTATATYFADSGCGVSDCPGSAGGVDCGCDSACDSACGNVYGEFQYLNLDTYATEDNFNGKPEAAGGFRFVVGGESAGGLGIRARYFSFDGVQDIPGDELNGLDLEYFDIEVTDRFSLCGLQGVVSAGFRHAEYTAYDGDDAGDPDEDFSGDGLTVGVQIERDITCRLGIYGWLQHSMLYGDDEGNDDENVLMGWTELQLGLQYAGCLGNVDTFVRAGVEVQRHQGMFNEEGEDTGLVGFVLSTGFVY